MTPLPPEKPRAAVIDPPLFELPAPSTARAPRCARTRGALTRADVSAAALALVGSGAVDVAHPLRLAGDAGLLALITAAAGLRRRDEQLLRKSTLEETGGLFQAVMVWCLTLMLAAPLTFGEDPRPRQLATLSALLLVLLLAGRAAARGIVRRTSQPERCLVVGDATTAEALARKFRVSFALHAEVVGRVTLTDETVAGAEVPALADLGSVRAATIAHEIDRIVIAAGDSDALDVIRTVEGLDVKLSVLPRVLEATGASVQFDDADGLTLLGVRRSSLTGLACNVKRGLDVVGATAGLVLLGPVMAVVALLIKLETPGPVLYRQTRVGRDGREFLMLKYRSMFDGADAQKAGLLQANETVGLFKIADDPRVTRIGRILRRSSLDELPQLWNVVRGQMSLVGPRPLVPEDDAKIEGWQRTRLNVTPGMTGVWQVIGSTRVPLEEMVKLDYVYAASWSVWLDTKILLRTIAYVIARRSA